MIQAEELQLEQSPRLPQGCTAACHWALRARRMRRLLERVRELEAGEQRLQALEAGLAAAAAEAEAAAAAQAIAAAAAAAEQDSAAAAALSAADEPPGCEVAARGERSCGSGSEAGSAPTALGADALYNPDWVRGAQSLGDDEVDPAEDVRYISVRVSQEAVGYHRH